MRFLALLVIIFSFKLSANENLVTSTASLLLSNQPSEGLSEYYKADKVAIFAEVLDEFGRIQRAECGQNHDSKLFVTVACFVSYKKQPSGMVWEFYFFKEKTQWVGTNLGILQIIPNEHCVSDLSFAGVLGQGITYKPVKCSQI